MTGAGGPLQYDAVVLAGGSARRLGGIDKPAQHLGGRVLLDRVLDALGDARRIVAVGPRRTTSRAVVWTREKPPGSGPVLALRAGLTAVREPLVAVLAADLPFLSAEVVAQLAAAAASDSDGAAGAVAVDDTGSSQWLLGCWRTSSLQVALANLTSAGGGNLRAVMAPLSPVLVRVGEGAGPPPWYDCDTPEELARAQAWAETSEASR